MLSSGSKRPVVVMGLSPTGLAAVRRLASLGVPCLGMSWGGSSEIGCHSRYLTRLCRVPYPLPHEQLLRELNELTAPWREVSPILIPASDVYASFVDEMQEELRPRYTFRCSSRKLHAAFADKARTIELCGNDRVLIPRSIAVEGVRDLASVCGEFRFPVIVKPRRSHGIEFPGKNVVARRPPELTGFFEARPHLLGRTVVQEVIPSGDGNIVVAVSYSGREGRVLAQATLRKLRQWPPDYGVTSFGRSEYIPAVASLVKRFLDGLGYQGFAAVEFAEETEDGRFFLLEVNPRLNLPTQLVLDAQVDVMQIAYREMTEIDFKLPAAPRQVDGVHWIDFRHDTLSFLEKYGRREISAPRWLRSIPRATSYAAFDARDWKPFLVSAREQAHELRVRSGQWLLQRLRRIVRGRGPRVVDER